MSASWDSEVRSGRVGGRAQGVATGVLLAIALGLMPVLALAASDSGRVVRSVRIGPAGIQIERFGPGDSTDRPETRARKEPEGVLKVGRHGVTVETRGSGEGESVVVGGDDSGSGTSIVVNTGDAGLVRLFADARVPAGKTIPGDVVAVFGSVDVGGTVEGDVVAVFGSVRLRSGASVEGDAIAIGGVLDQPPDAHVSGQSVAIGLLSPGWGVPTLATLLTVVFLGWLATLILGWLLALLFPERMLQIGSTASRHSAGSFFLGLLSAPLFVIALVLLFITVVGIPFALLLPFVYLLAIWTGQIAGSYVLGCRILRRRPGEGGLMGPILVGTFLVALCFGLGAGFAVPEGLPRTLSLFFTLLGVLLVVGLSVIGTGALILSRVGSRQAPSASAVGAVAVGTPVV
jgi:hypothetical protein